MVDPRGVELEQIARIIEPAAFRFHDEDPEETGPGERWDRMHIALTKAAQIAALYADTITKLRGELEVAQAERDEWGAAVEKNWPGVYSKWTTACGRAETERVRANLAEEAQVVTLREALEAANGILKSFGPDGEPDAEFVRVRKQVREALAIVGGEGQGSGASVAQSSGTRACATPPAKSDSDGGH